MNSAPKVSVIIPSYRHAPYLLERLESVLGQTLRDFELIVIDDGSTDGSREVIERYRGDRRVRVIFHDCNEGITATTNEGLALARSEYVHIAESDDVCAPNFLERLCAMLDRYPRVGLVHAALRVVDAGGRALQMYRDNFPVDLRAHLAADYVADGREEFRRLVQGINFISSFSGVVFRRACYVELGGRDPRFPLAGDWHLWLRYCLAWDVAYTAEPLVDWRYHGDTVRRELSGYEVKRDQYGAMRDALERARFAAGEKRRLWCGGCKRLRWPLRELLGTQLGNRRLGEFARTVALGLRYDPAGVAWAAVPSVILERVRARRSSSVL